MKILNFKAVTGLAIVIILLAFLWKPLARFVMKKTDPLVKFQNAWISNDSIYIKNYITELENKTFPDLALCTTILSEETNVCFGDYDRKLNWDTIPESRKDIIKHNLIEFWNGYSNSKLFLNKKIGNINFQKCYNDTAKFSSKDITDIISSVDKNN